MMDNFEMKSLGHTGHEPSGIGMRWQLNIIANLPFVQKFEILVVLLMASEPVVDSHDFDIRS